MPIRLVLLLRSAPVALERRKACPRQAGRRYNALPMFCAALRAFSASFSRSICIPRCRFTRTEPCVSTIRAAISGPAIPHAAAGRGGDRRGDRVTDGTDAWLGASEPAAWDADAARYAGGASAKR